MVCVYCLLCCDIIFVCRLLIRVYFCFLLSDDLSIKNIFFVVVGDGCIKGIFIFELFISGGF